jgi:hypothetical protein
VRAWARARLDADPATRERWRAIALDSARPDVVLETLRDLDRDEALSLRAALDRRLADADGSVRIEAACALARAGEIDAAQRTLERLAADRSADEEARGLALERLGTERGSSGPLFDAARAIATLSSVIPAEEPDSVKACAARGLAALEAQRPAGVLARALVAAVESAGLATSRDDEGEQPWLRIARSMVKNAPDLEPPAGAGGAEPTPSDARDAPARAAARESARELRLALVAALAASTPRDDSGRVTQTLVIAATDPDDDVRAMAIAALAAIDGDPPRAALGRTLERERDREASARSRDAAELALASRKAEGEARVEALADLLASAPLSALVRRAAGEVGHDATARAALEARIRARLSPPAARALLDELAARIGG